MIWNVPQRSRSGGALIWKRLEKIENDLEKRLLFWNVPDMGIRAAPPKEGKSRIRLETFGHQGAPNLGPRARQIWAPGFGHQGAPNLGTRARQIWAPGRRGPRKREKCDCAFG